MSVATKAAIDDAVLAELREILGDPERVLPNISSRVNRTRIPAPFPVHRWQELLPDVAVLPTSAEQVSEVLKLANRHRSRSSRAPAEPGSPTARCPCTAGSWSTSS